jgi:hypothetical protein
MSKTDEPLHGLQWLSEYLGAEEWWMRKPTTWADADDALVDLMSGYRRSMWQDADVCVEVWCESDSIAGVLWPVTRKWDLPLYPAKGQSSITFAYGAAMTYRDEPRPLIIYYIGDRDPAGLEIEANLERKLAEYSGREIPIRRLACTWAQVSQLGLIGGPPKKKTWRHPTFGSQPFIGEAVEVEAIDAPILRQIVEDAIVSHIDPHVLRSHKMSEREEREGLQRILDRRWSE